MILIDNALKQRAKEGRPVRVAIAGAGFMARGLANRIVNTTPGMVLTGVYARKIERARELCEYCSAVCAETGTQAAVAAAARGGAIAITEDAFVLTRSEDVDVIVDTTGSVEFGARMILDAFKHGKDVVLMNAEIDATIGPILQTYADRYGVILSACEGDEPGV